MPISPLSPERQRLAAQYWPLALSIARAAGDHPEGRETWTGIAAMAIVDAAARYREGIGSFGGFARLKIGYAILDERRRIGARLPEEHWEDLGDVVEPEKVRDHEIDESREAAAALLRGLPAGYQRLMRAIYIDGHNQKEAARTCGVCQSRGSSLHHHSLAMLRADHSHLEPLPCSR